MSLWNVPLADIDLSDDEIRAVTDVLRSKWLSMGPVTAEFERQFATMVGVKHALAVTNCTAALHLAHLALGAGAEGIYGTSRFHLKAGLITLRANREIYYGKQTFIRGRIESFKRVR